MLGFALPELTPPPPIVIGISGRRKSRRTPRKELRFQAYKNQHGPTTRWPRRITFIVFMTFNPTSIPLIQPFKRRYYKSWDFGSSWESPVFEWTRSPS